MCTGACVQPAQSTAIDDTKEVISMAKPSVIIIEK